MGAGTPHALRKACKLLEKRDAVGAVEEQGERLAVGDGLG